MTLSLMIGTRKGLFFVDQRAEGWTIARHLFSGIPVSATLRDPRDGALYAALNHGHFGVKLHRSEDGGASWSELAAPAFPQGFDAAAAKPPSVSLLWTLEAAGKDAPGTLWAGTIPGALFRSDDRGASWSLNEPLWRQEARKEWSGGGYDDPGIHSILLDPHDSKRMVLGVSTGGVWLSEDAGKSWNLGGEGLFAGYMPQDRHYDPVVQDTHRLVMCPAAPARLWTQHHCGVFRSDDGGLHWVRIKGLPISDFGFAVAVHPRDPDRAWFVPAESDEKRAPIDGRFIVNTTRDGGRSFVMQDKGLPAQPAYDLVYRHALAVAPDGETLAMGSTTGSLWTSSNGGAEWRLANAHLPPIACVRFAA